jgi:hypothetical protein
MRGLSRLVLLVSTLVLASLVGVRPVQAQTEKALQQGQVDPIPYISHAEFQNVSVGGTGSGKSSSSQTTFRDILAVTSLEEVTHHFGEPTSTEYKRAPKGISTDYIVYMKYNGISFKYRKRGGKIRLETMAITSKDRFLRIGGMRLRPGMNIDSLSAVIQKAIEDDSDGVIGIKVARPGKSKDDQSILDSHTSIQIWTSKDQKRSTVKEVRFHRIAP